MALTAFSRLRMLWGALDWQAGSGNPYSVGQTQSGGPSAAPGAGVGVRRCVIGIDRATQHPGADHAEMHFDFLNFTGGAVDDTWTTGDYTTLEGYLDTFLLYARTWQPSGVKFDSYTWYRHGPGVTAPNPFERQNIFAGPIAGTGSGNVHPPQVATTLTFRTAVRRSWGRTYMPASALTLSGTATVPTGGVDALAAAVQTMVNSAASSDFALVVTSAALSAALVVEKIEVDDNLDIIRRRRWKQSTYRKTLP